ncbi:MAG: DUF1223 domain-containing protein [Boseongicola sp.]
MTRICYWIAALWTSLASWAMAEGPVVVELFTSQGCSSCPPADALLAEISERSDVIALAFHVDYWDYIGWKDQFADPEHTVRQRGYSRAAGKRSIYTPQMIIGGKDHIIGSKPMKLVELIEFHRNAPVSADVALERDGDRVAIRVSAKKRIPKGGAVIQIATFTPQETVNIRRGENAGHTLTYHNIVRDIAEVGKWAGRGTYRATVRVPQSTPIAVLVQQRNHGSILGAAQLKN